MDPVTASTVIARPREEVFEYLADIANRAEFTDHFLVDWHLTRVDSYGRGAGARFRVMAPRNRFGWADTTIVEADLPYRLLELGRGGKNNRVKTCTTFTLTSVGSGMTKVQYTTETEPATLADHLVELFGGTRRWTKRRIAKALERLRLILEQEDREQARGKRATVAGL